MPASACRNWKAFCWWTFLKQYSGTDSTGLVEIAVVTYRIVDIGMRSLQPHEIYCAQGFPEWYIID
ncbi:hypothetical protein YA21_15170 [Klebsiella aerogenes]|jgi:DNA (cytosine-5)-methyltransferase 1|nr:hypothetical protein YA21_15170 [Klebsiella aerogenes]KTI98208.1 hypothetical protein ASU92_15405 [Klebsiella aerogenes]